LNLVPFHTETFVSALSKKEVLGHLSKVTSEVNYLDKRTQGDSRLLFYGMVGQRGFRISKAIQRGDTFLPMLLGKVEETPRGSIIFLKYKLFPGAIFFLAFWSVILLAFSGYYFGVTDQFLYGSICLGLAIFNYFLALFFFQRQVKSSREIFYNFISFQMKD
jgi:hypothetical protein